MTPEQKMARQVALNRVKDAARRADEARAAAEVAQTVYAQAVAAALEQATGDEVAAAAGRSRWALYKAIHKAKERHS